MMNQYDVAAYIWPSYTGDEPRARIFWPEGIGEWETVRKRMHQKPLWGCENEADPAVMERQIAQAKAHGINTFIYDWYWYDNRPFLEQCLNNGFLGAANNAEMTFYLMWANHTANTLWDLRNSHDQRTAIWDGAVNFSIFRDISRRWMQHYFGRENYFRIDGKPVLSVFDTGNLIRGLGGADSAARAMDWLREEMVRAGFGGLHLQLIKFGNGLLRDGGQEYTFFALLDRLGADSFTHYQTACYASGEGDYSAWFGAMETEWAAVRAATDKIYFPHVSAGWGSQPRYLKPTKDNMTGCTPENFRRALEMAKACADGILTGPKLITVNSWNEWTETSYLQPDDLTGYARLEAVRDVFSVS
ncbi:MAG: glycoside hydrolase family 99-like domain-containing protein [Oscillospiraceae bacterium]|jgi:hypothetical protein|nr:glycoside hydrolase family 99-like domain-containing protein [Oscillospiraceae bacterium]